MLVSTFFIYTLVGGLSLFVDAASPWPPSAFAQAAAVLSKL